MSDAALARLAAAAGINTDWLDAHGQPQQVSPQTQRLLLSRLGLPADSPAQIRDSQQALDASSSCNTLPPLITHDESVPLPLSRHGNVQHYTGCHFRIVLNDDSILTGTVDARGELPPLPPGYHHLQIRDDEHVLAVAPQSCPPLRSLGRPQLGSPQRDMSPQRVESPQPINNHHPRLWGIAVQLHSLRSPHTCGVGDTGALEALIGAAAAKGADAIAISPVHAMSPGDFDHYSPYSPTSRLFLNVIHAAPDRILGSEAVNRAMDQCQLRDELQRLESLSTIDWMAVFHARNRLLRQLHDNFVAAHGPFADDFHAFVAAGGSILQDHCRFEAIHGYMRRTGHSGDWRSWPAGLRHPGYSSVQMFAAEHAHEVSFHAFVQWLTARSFERAEHAATYAGMRVGLISDLAVGVASGGSETWSRPEEFLAGLCAGAPPDIVNTQGQNWHLSAFSPTGLRRHGFRSYLEMLRASLAFSGGVRVDHVMGLQRQWLVPDGCAPTEGAYLNYPMEDLLRLLTLEAWRHQALVIGEDLGTVPEGFREELASRNILGMRVLQFEHENQTFIPAERWPRAVMATTTTHDLPTTKGWFLGRDIDWRVKAGHCTPDDAVAAHQQRRRENLALISAVHHNGNGKGNNSVDSTLDACLRFVASTPSCLALLPLEDLMGSVEQPNLPGPGNIHPNWRRRWDADAASMLSRPEVSARLAMIDALRRDPNARLMSVAAAQNQENGQAQAQARGAAS